MRDFAAHGTIKEKYDVVTGKSDLAEDVWYGYVTNEVGFGWTNAAFVLLYEEFLKKLVAVAEAAATQ
jgi:alpha,alpha-trehalase